MSSGFLTLYHETILRQIGWTAEKLDDGQSRFWSEFGKWFRKN